MVLYKCLRNYTDFKVFLTHRVCQCTDAYA